MHSNTNAYWQQTHANMEAFLHNFVDPTPTLRADNSDSVAEQAPPTLGNNALGLYINGDVPPINRPTLSDEVVVGPTTAVPISEVLAPGPRRAFVRPRWFSSPEPRPSPPSTPVDPTTHQGYIHLPTGNGPWPVPASDFNPPAPLALGLLNLPEGVWGPTYQYEFTFPTGHHGQAALPQPFNMQGGFFNNTGMGAFENRGTPLAPGHLNLPARVWGSTYQGTFAFPMANHGQAARPQPFGMQGGFLNNTGTGAFANGGMRMMGGGEGMYTARTGPSTAHAQVPFPTYPMSGLAPSWHLSQEAQDGPRGTVKE
ncbi:uncharacterized protein BXZ73DRAFT_75325 [Epithele typhae]|uniref:uncharacterized protein n=1 Tax=Epithele typhae TaxID=378194 RepID=UPI002007C82C|nr:uncharacterized protein BXZ73DRAFT_75325 [Epithele typhae]KAH9940779.1 hypothetical protein BXZ73DRAFT_75325 [Epithele typhae]